jgi:hypothetical protein
VLKNDFQPSLVIPAEAGIQSFESLLDSRFCGSDSIPGFFNSLRKNSFDKRGSGKMDFLSPAFNY